MAEDGVELIELRRLCDILGQEIYFECNACLHLSRFDYRRWTQGAVGRGSKTLYEIRKAATCTECDGKSVTLLEKMPGLKGDGGWRPRPPRSEVSD